MTVVVCFFVTIQPYLPGHNSLVRDLFFVPGMNLLMSGGRDQVRLNSTNVSYLLIVRLLSGVVPVLAGGGTHRQARH
jgi:hypothetical protein